MEIKYSTKYDYFQAFYGLVSFLILLSINSTYGTIALSVLILLFSIYKAFGRKIIFHNDFFVVKYFYAKKRFKYLESSEVAFVPNIYGKSFVRVVCFDKIYKGYVNYSDWEMLKNFLSIKGVKCKEYK